MSQEIKDFLDTCPGCEKALEPNWFVCPHCGLRVKPGNDFIARSLLWTAVLLAFVMMVLYIAKHDEAAASGFAAVIGIPLAYVFGKAILFRLMGKPLSWQQLRRTTIRVGMITFIYAVVIPTIIGIAMLLLLFAICGFNR